jgi:alpha-galactosidase
MMDKLGYDIVVNKLAYSQQVLQTYTRLKDIMWHGDLFRLVSPYRSDHVFASLMYVNENQDRAICFTYLVDNRYRAGINGAIRVKGLNPMKRYTIQEINIYPGTDNSTIISANSLSGDYLMIYGFDPMLDIRRSSVILEFVEHIL